MNDIPTPRTNRFYASFADGECIPNQDEWLALCESIESELTAARKEVDGLHYALKQSSTIYDAVTEQRDRLAEALKLIATWHSYDELHDEVIECEDFAFGYDEAIKISREALQSLREDQNEL